MYKKVFEIFNKKNITKCIVCKGEVTESEGILSGCSNKYHIGCVELLRKVSLFLIN